MDCDCNCNAKCKMLGGLEQKIMEVLWSSDIPLKPADVKAKMADEHAYTTIMTVLKRMADKDLVSRTAKGNTFYYSPCFCKTEFASTALDDLFSRLFKAYGENVVSSFKKIAKQEKYTI